MALSWVAIHSGADGEVYCAPACGARCKTTDFIAAHQRAGFAIHALGRDWKPRIWENMGWHSAVISPCGRIKLHINVYRGKISGYTAFLGDPDSPGGNYAEHGATPRTAVRAVIAAAQADLARIGAMLTDLPPIKGRAARRT